MKTVAILFTLYHFGLTAFGIKYSGISYKGQTEPLKVSDYHGQSQLQIKSMLGGLGRSTSAGIEIDDVTIAKMPSCDFYTVHGGKCYPKDKVTDCEFCKASGVRLVGTVQCPGQESFPQHLQGKYKWILHPIKKKLAFKRIFVCMVHGVAAGEVLEEGGGGGAPAGAGTPVGRLGFYGGSASSLSVTSLLLVLFHYWFILLLADS